MIYVLTGNHQQFRAFCFEYNVREMKHDKGQVRYLAHPDALRGIQNGIVLCWGTWRERKDAREIEDYCAARDIPLLPVPDLRRVRYFREGHQT